MLDSLIKFFNSLKLTLFLIITTAILASVGTFIPQGEDNYQALIDKYGQASFDRLHGLGITDAYSSWWFLSVMLLFALNLIACTIVRLPKVWKLTTQLEENRLAPELSYLATSFARDLESGQGEPSLLDRAQGLLGPAYGRLRVVRGAGSTAVIGEKNKLALWGAYIVHAGLLLLLLGGALKNIAGYSKYMYILEGGKTYIPREELHFGLWMDRLSLPFTSRTVPLPRFYTRGPSHHMTEVQLNEFDLEYYPNTTMPKLFRSKVTVVAAGGASRTAEILVNDPLKVDGDLLYQSSYGYQGLHAAEIDVMLPGSSDIYQVTAPYKQRFKLQDSGWELEITDFYPEADMGKPGQIVQTGTQLNNPAVRLKFYQHGRERAHFWYVYAFPSIQMSKIKGLEVRGKTVDPIPFTVLQVGHDPGLPFALLGALTVLAGLWISFYMPWRKAWILATPAAHGFKLRLVGQCKHNKLSFGKEFEKLAAAFERDFR